MTDKSRNEIDLQRSNTERNLGVLIDCCLNYSEHISKRTPEAAPLSFCCRQSPLTSLPLDAVITPDKNGRPTSVTVTDVGLSDHFLLRWEVNTIRDSPTPVHVCSRQ